METYNMFIEVLSDGTIQYDVIKFTPEDEWGEEIVTVADGPKSWELAMEDIAVFSPSVIKVQAYCAITKERL